jgi:hypothetical protein
MGLNSANGQPMERKDAVTLLRKAHEIGGDMRSEYIYHGEWYGETMRLTGNGVPVKRFGMQAGEPAA